MSVINIIKLMMASTLTCMVYACDFTEKNIDPNSPTSIEPGPLLTYTQLHTNTGGIAKNIQVGTCMMLVQQAASLNNDMPGDKYYQMESYANTFFTDTYSDLIKNWRELEEKASSDAKYSNILGATKIWGAYLFQRLTDIYGNVPYSEAGLGYYQQIYKPKYDNQETIYKDMIQQVKDGVNLLNANNPAIDGDLFYDGDINKWKKFGGSLLLRIGMRLSEVAPDLAKQTVADAVTIGVMSQPEDICLLRHDGSGKNAFKNPLSFRYLDDNFIESDAVKIGKTFMDYLKKTKDPRIHVYCSLKDGNTEFDKQFGLPNGYDSHTIADAPSGSFVGLENTSNFNINTILRLDAPTIFLMPSETKLLLAEAVLRNWTNGNAEVLYKEAITSSMKEQEIAYGTQGKITDEEIETYLAQNLLSTANNTEKLQIIGEQYWVATFINGYESYANWRRTGYPKLIPTNYSGSMSPGVIPTRLPYPTDEYSINRANVDTANQQQGADKVTTHIWWDID